MEDVLAEIERLRRKIQELEQTYKKPVVEHAPCEVTVLVPCGKGSLLYLYRALCSVERGAQSVPVALHLICQENAKAEQAALEADMAEWSQRFVKVELLSPAADRGDRMANICLVRKRLAESLNTPFGLYLDADVRMPAGGVGALLDAMKADPHLGACGIIYEWATDHVKAGCTMFRKEVLDQLDWYPKPCECMWANQAIKQMLAPDGEPYKVQHLSGWFARHMSREQFA